MVRGKSPGEIIGGKSPGEITGGNYRGVHQGQIAGGKSHRPASFAPSALKLFISNFERNTTYKLYLYAISGWKIEQTRFTPISQPIKTILFQTPVVLTIVHTGITIITTWYWMFAMERANQKGHVARIRVNPVYIKAVNDR